MFPMMKPKKDSITSDSFDDLLKEAVKKYKELERLRQPAKLSAGAFFKNSLEIAGITEDRLIETEKVVVSGPRPS